MPAGIVNDYCFPVFHIGEFIDDSVCLVGYLFIEFASFVIVLVDVFTLLAG